MEKVCYYWLRFVVNYCFNDLSPNTIVYMKVNDDVLLRLMQEVELGLENLLLDISQQQKEIDKLKNENEQLKDNYAKVLEEIAAYIAELEAIKHSNT